MCERGQGTDLQEFYRPFFHRACIDRVIDLNAGPQRWTEGYNKHRPNHGDYMAGRTPREVMRELKTRMRKTAA